MGSNKKEDGTGYLERKNVKEVVISLSELKLEVVNKCTGSSTKEDNGDGKPGLTTPIQTRRDKRKRKGRKNA